MTLSTPSRTPLDKPENIINLEPLSQLSQSQEEPGQRSIRKQTREAFKGLKLIDGIEMSYCSFHKEWHPVTDFNKDRTRACGVQGVSREASAFYTKLSREFTIPPGTICAFPNCTAVASERDHDHKTDEFRNFLCHMHTSLLGYADDDIEVLQGAIEYITTHETIN